MEEKNKKEHAFSGFFDNCRSSYDKGSKQSFGFNNSGDDEVKKEEDEILLRLDGIDAKLKVLKRMLE